jgi:hypothetical protein
MLSIRKKRKDLVYKPALRALSGFFFAIETTSLL